MVAAPAIMAERAAVPAIADPLVLLDHPEEMVVMELLVNRVNLALQAIKVHPTSPCWTDIRNCAPAKLLLVTQVAQVTVDPTVQLETLAPRVPTANLEIKDHVDHPEITANLATLDKKDLLAKLENLRLCPVPKVYPAAPVVQARLAPLVNQEIQAKTDSLAPLDLLANQVNLEAQENQAPLAQMAMLENQETPAAAPTARQLVWLLAINNHLTARFIYIKRPPLTTIINNIINNIL